jgi:serine/threonine-protein kinase RsbW
MERADLAEGTTSRVSLTLESSLVSVHAIETTAQEYASAAGFSSDIASHLSMVAGEAAANAVIHGNKYDTAKQVTATFEITDSSLTIKVADQGEGVDPESIPDPLAPENLLRSSGRGVFLMRAFMDEVHFRRLDPGTEISLVKHRIQAS